MQTITRASSPLICPSNAKYSINNICHIHEHYICSFGLLSNEKLNLLFPKPILQFCLAKITTFVKLSTVSWPLYMHVDIPLHNLIHVIPKTLNIFILFYLSKLKFPHTVQALCFDYRQNSKGYNTILKFMKTADSPVRNQFKIILFNKCSSSNTSYFLTSYCELVFTSVLYNFFMQVSLEITIKALVVTLKSIRKKNCKD